MTVTIESLTKAGNFLPTQALLYSDACKTHLDLGSNDGRTLRGLDKDGLTCVELFAPSVQKMRKAGITAHCRDIRDFVAESVKDGLHWDRVTAFDVIEHIPRADGERLLDQIERLAMREVVVFMPIETPELEATAEWNRFREEALSMHPDAQRELHDHRSRWSPEDFQRRGYITLVLPNFHYEGFGAFFAARYRDPGVQAEALERIRAYAAGTQPPTWGHLGKGSGVNQPLLLNGIDRMFLGDGVGIGAFARLECLKGYNGVAYEPTLVIGDKTTAENFLQIGCVKKVTIGRDCLIASGVYLSDHEHLYDPSLPLHGQSLSVEEVEIGNSVFLGQNVSVLKGSRIGDHSVIGAHSVVKGEIPPYSVAVGAPARVIRKMEGPSD